jgi:uncharacterized protein involved in exopolysaccharide biosynthesis
LIVDTRTNALEDGGDDFTLLDLAVLVAKHKVFILVVPSLAGLVAFIILLLTPPIYTASAKILPPQQNQPSALALLGQLGLGNAAGGATQALGLKNPNDLYVAMLKSRTVADRLIDRFDLQKAYGEVYRMNARRELERKSIISAARDGVIAIDVDDQDPKRAAHLANAYVEELKELTSQLALTEASQRRLFFEAQLVKSKNDLVTAELELKKYTKDAGLVSPDGQIGLSVSAAAALRAQITAKEIQLSAMRTFATDSNPDMKRTLQELQRLRTELARMERDPNAPQGDVMVPFGKASDVGLEYVRRYREVKYYEALFEIIARQYEMARMDEAKHPTLIQVLDFAVPPEKHSKPKRAIIVVITVLSAGLLVLVFAYAHDRLHQAAEDPRRSRKVQELFSLFTFRRRR